MSKILDISNKLGEYLLKGHILTDEPCPTCSIPMLRTPIRTSQPQVLFCSQCPDEAREVDHKPVSGSDNTDLSRPLRQTAESFEPGLSASQEPFDSSEILRRRAQSDRASTEIGNRMLKGWAMLAEECPNESCYGIPLVRPPKSGVEKDPKKECVVCGSVYVHERTADGQVILKKQNQALTTTTTPRALNNVYTKDPLISPGEDTKASHELPQRTLGGIPDNASSTAGQHALINAKTPLITTLSTTITSLQYSLEVLSTRLTSVTSISPPDHILIGELAHTIEQISSALGAVNTLHIRQKNWL